MVRSAFRPSDDACTYQLLVPANMMLARYLAACAPIMAQLGRADGDSGSDHSYSYGHRSGRRERYYQETADRMTTFAETIRLGIERHGRVHHPAYGSIYAYEVDGFGSHNLMDDANIPSLLSAPLLGFVGRDDPVYRNTRRFVLSTDNPYYMHGPVINGWAFFFLCPALHLLLRTDQRDRTGGPHVGAGMAWPMSLIVQIMTSDDDYEIVRALQQLVSSTDGLGLMHEAVSSHNEGVWTRQWYVLALSRAILLSVASLVFFSFQFLTRAIGSRGPTGSSGRCS
jgi:meiotically up-regulated gene 157 (Mug157) protein